MAQNILQEQAKILHCYDWKHHKKQTQTLQPRDPVQDYEWTEELEHLLQ